MSGEELKKEMLGLKKVSIIYVDNFIFSKMIFSMSSEEIDCLQKYYEFLIKNNSMTVFDKYKYDVILDYKNTNLNFGFLNTNIGMLMYSKN